MNLIPEWENDRVILVLPNVFMNYYNDDLAELELFYADFLVNIAKYDQVSCFVPNLAYAEKMARLTGLSLAIFPLANFPDIWLRDFAPIQLENGYVKFIYNPSYTVQKVNDKLSKIFLNTLSFQPLKELDICLEGGNFIHNGEGTIIVTEKIYSQNKNKTKLEINELLKEHLLLKKIVVVPVEPGDKTGHIDGMMRWISPERLVINDYQIYGNNKFFKNLQECLEENLSNVDLISIPYVPSGEKTYGWVNALGNYVNFLRTKNQAYVPTYNLNEDEKIQTIYSQLFGEKVTFLPGNIISKYGGVFNCMTWTYRESALQIE